MAVVFFLAIVALIWWPIYGWQKWFVLRRESSTKPLYGTTVAWALASASAILYLGTILVGQIRRWPFYDPVLMAIYKIGLLLALVGLLSGIVLLVLRRKLALHTTAISALMLGLWLLAASME